MTPESDRLLAPAGAGAPRKFPSWRADAALVGNTIIWGSTFVLVQSALHDISPLAFLAIRFSIATLALILLFRGRIRFSVAAKAGMLAGICLFSGYVFQTVGLQFTTAAKSAFITGLSIPMVPLLASLVYFTRPRILEVVGVIFATTGMGLMTLQGANFRIGLGDLLTLFCAAAFAMHMIALGHYSTRVGFESVAFLQVAASAVLALGSFWWAESPVLRLRPLVLVALLVTGLLATALAFTVQAWAQQHTTPTRTALIYSLEPVVAWVTSFLLTGETLSRRGMAGAGMILAGILLVELKRVHSQ
ncbi:MAG: EamA/RhaT family transporter [Acidobacteria bacterium]|nr:MAG: EamA/RhaT family transporter [Acidobacteriota bacterium]